LTFGAVTRTLPIVIYSHFRMLVSLLIVVTLALVFLWGGSRVLNAVTEATPPAPSATPQPAIERPTVVPVTRSTKAARGAHAPGGTPAACP
jgi:hypothetical protein